jgi:hypothetical protein
MFGTGAAGRALATNAYGIRPVATSRLSGSFVGVGPGTGKTFRGFKASDGNDSSNISGSLGSWI